MKIFALSQNVVGRMGKDLPDIAFLSVIHDLDLEGDIRPSCRQFGTPEVYDLIRGQVKSLKKTMKNTLSIASMLPPRLSMDEYADFVEASLKDCNRIHAARQKEIEKRIKLPFSIPEDKKKST